MTRPIFRLAALAVAGWLAASAPALPPTGRLSGTVVDEQGRPVVGLSLQFAPADASGGPPRTLKTSKAGAFSHAFFPVGEYRIEIEDPGRFVKSMTYVLEDESGIELSRQSGEAGPDRKLPAFQIRFGHRVELALVLASRERSPELAQAAVQSGAHDPLAKIKASYEAGDMQAVAEQGQKLVGEHPDLGFAQYMLGLAQSRLGQTDAALLSLQKALELIPEQQGVAGALGTVMLQKGRALAAEAQPEQAREEFARAATMLQQELDRFGPSAVYLANRAAVLEAAGNREALGPALETLVQADPGNLAAWLKLVDLQADNNQLDAALDTLRRAPRSEPKNVALSAYNLAARAFNAGNAAQAIAAAELGISADPALPALYRVLGRAQFSSHNHEAAIAALTKLLQLAPDDPEAATDRKMLEQLEAGGS